MSNVKIALALDKDFFEEIEELADKMRISKSQLLETAAKEFVQRHNGGKSSADTSSEEAPATQM